MKAINSQFVILILLTIATSVQAQYLKTFPEIPGRVPSDKYVCRVRVVGANSWKDAFVLQTVSKPEVTVNGSNTSGYKNGSSGDRVGEIATEIFCRPM